jgi:hypothetical protein
MAYEEIPKPCRAGTVETAIRIEPDPPAELRRRLLGVTRHATLVNTLARPPEANIYFGGTAR